MVMNKLSQDMSVSLEQGLPGFATFEGAKQVEKEVRPTICGIHISMTSMISKQAYRLYW